MSFENVDKLRRMTTKTTQSAYSISFMDLDSGEQRTSDCQNPFKDFFQESLFKSVRMLSLPGTSCSYFISSLKVTVVSSCSHSLTLSTTNDAVYCFEHLDP